MSCYSPIRSGRRDERGYVLLALLLTMALLVVFAAAIMPTIKFQIERDREEELIHRGTQYSRAIRGYYKKFGRYPVKIEDLESTNNLRFLRKRYKDPTNCAGGKCQDFKLLHFGEVRLTGAMMGIPGAQMVGSPGVTIPAAGTSGSPAQVSAFGGNNGYGANANSSAVAVPPAAQAAGSDSPPVGDDASKASGSSGSDNSSAPSGGDTTAGSGGGTTGSTSGPGAGQVFGGGPIVGVVSTNKKDTIREFNHKKKYNEWQFIYDPGTDRGGLLMTPNQPPLTPFGQQPGQNVNGQNGGATPTGLQNNPNSPGTEQLPATPSDPNNPPEQK